MTRKWTRRKSKKQPTKRGAFRKYLVAAIPSVIAILFTFPITYSMKSGFDIASDYLRSPQPRQFVDQLTQQKPLRNFSPDKPGNFSPDVRQPSGKADGTYGGNADGTYGGKADGTYGSGRFDSKDSLGYGFTGRSKTSKIDGGYIDLAGPNGGYLDTHGNRGRRSNGSGFTYSDTGRSKPDTRGRTYADTGWYDVGSSYPVYQDFSIGTKKSTPAVTKTAPKKRSGTVTDGYNTAGTVTDGYYGSANVIDGTYGTTVNLGGGYDYDFTDSSIVRLVPTKS
jgi:hypothetical protein